MSNRSVFYLVMAVLCCAASIWNEDTLKEIGYLVMMCFWVLLVGLEYLIKKQDETIKKLNSMLDNLKEE